MSQRFYLLILKSGIFLTFISVFLVLPNLFFPFITSKQIFFNILVEIMTVFWLAYAIKWKSEMPKESLITFGLAAFFGALLISSFFGVDFNLSFWGDLERMLGWFHIFHFFLFYLIIITVFRSWRDWRNLLIVSIVASTIVCLDSIFRINFSTLGNTSYVSGYAIFNIFFALILFFRYRNEKTKNWLISSLYLIATFIMILVMKGTNTRGAIVGLGISFLLFFILFIFHSKNKKVKICSIATIILGIVLVSLIFLFPQSKIVKSVPVFQRITQISSNAVTFQTRLISWKAAYKGLQNHIFLGTGYGNFAITFDKYFDSKFYNYTTSETYFDRAHNNLIDITSTAGLISLLSYLSIFVAVFYYLFIGKKQNKISINEFILLICLFVAYFIQNLAIFDSFATYFSLMIVLGYVYWLINQGEEEKPDRESRFVDKELAILFIAGAFFMFIIYQYNIKVYYMLDGSILGYKSFAAGDIEKGIADYKKALSLNTVLNRDSRANLVNFLIPNFSNLSKLGEDKSREIFDFAIQLAEENVKYNPADSVMQMQLAQILNTASMAYFNQRDKFYYFSDRALEAIDKSIAASPGRVTIYPIKAQIYITRNEKEKAIETLKYAISLNENFYDGYCNLAKIYFYFKDEKAGFKVADKCLDYGGVGVFGNQEMSKGLINYYLANKDWSRVIILYKESVRIQPKDLESLIGLARAYEGVGDKENAIKTAQKTIELDPQLKDNAENFIKSLK